MDYGKFIFRCIFLGTILLLQCVKFSDAVVGGRGRWQLLLNNTGLVAMHMALTIQNTVVMIDRTDTGTPDSRSSRHDKTTRTTRPCRRRTTNRHDPSCNSAQSVEYDILRNRMRPLRLSTDSWCSSGSILSTGTIVQTGGHGNGYRTIQYFNPCLDRHCEWRQSRTRLSHNRWYASNQLLPDDDRVIVVGGINAFSYEFVPRSSSRSFNLPFLQQTYDRNEMGNNLYPILHLSTDGNLFILANRDSILLNYKQNRVIKEYPSIPGNGSRTYPSSGSSVILPLDHKNGFEKVEVLICGGAASGAFTAASRKSQFLKGERSCGRMVITGNNHKWNMEKMPGPRIMSDMVILPTGRILIVNGARRGCAGANRAASPSFNPYIYKPRKPLGRRFEEMKSTKIARMHHSSAVLLPDGRILIAGGNPNNGLIFKNVTYPTELRLQAFVPPHMDRKFDSYRPTNVSTNFSSRGDAVRYGGEFVVHFRLERKPGNVIFSAYAPPFTTHSVSMNQRMLKLKNIHFVREKGGWVNAVLEAPPSANVAPPGYYLFTVVNDGIPSISQWLRFIH